MSDRPWLGGSLVVVMLVASLAGCASPHHNGHPGVGPSRAVSGAASGAASAVPRVDRRPLVASARWVAESPGYQLRIRPSRYGRAHARRTPRQALAQALAAARPAPLRLPQPVRRSLRHQLRCHAQFAPQKPTWDLETWRPDVSYLRTVLAQCNP